MSEPAGRTSICSVVFIDIVRYSETPVAQQLAMKERLNEAIARALGGISEHERVILDTGDGAAICLLGDPEDALFTATAINDAIRREAGEGAQVLRTGINLGPIKLVTDLTGRKNVIGDGINVAQRIMSFADEGEILVSRSYYEVVARLREGNERLFRYMGAKRDKHVREHQLYAFGLDAERPHPCQPVEPVVVEPQARAPAATAPGTVMPEAVVLDGALVAVAEARLADHIGPLAKVIARRAAEQAASLDAFHQSLAAAIPDAADRSSFLAELSPETTSAGSAAPAAAGDVSEAPATPRQPIAAADIEEAERRLAGLIGPLAAVLVKKAAQAATDRRDLYLRLGAHIANPADRAAFLGAVDADA